MTEFWKAAAIVILAVVLGTAIGKTEKDIAVVLSAAVCCVVAGTAIQYLSEVLAFLWKLNDTVGTRLAFLEPLVKMVGVSILTELTCLISTDAGNASLGKAMQILGNAMILVLALPFFEDFYLLVQDILRML